MATAGYSGTPLLKKLDIKEDMKIWLLDAPSDYFDILGSDISSQLCGSKNIPDMVHLFAKNNTVFVKAMLSLEPLYKKNTTMIIWVSWYKKSAGIATDITEDIIRNYALQHDLVDVKVCAVNEAWSGLKLVVPLAKRRK
jgi:hypothetical protein